jgi:aspartokinase
VTNALLRCLDEALAPSLSPEARLASYRWITGAHAALAGDMGLTPADYAPVGGLLDELKRLLDGISLTQEVSPKLRARVAAFGELLSSQVGVAYLRHQLAGSSSVGSGATAVTRVDSRSLLTAVDADVGGDAGGPGGLGAGGGPHVVLSEADQYLEADVRPSVQPDRANAAAQGADVVIAQGFIASTPSGATCLLGRGGSDTSGALFAAYVGAARLEIWTDVNGMFTADPRYVPSARLIRSLTYREAQELAAMGAKVLHPRCLLPAAFAGIPVQVRNTLDAGAGAEMTVVSSSGTDYARSGGGGSGDDSPTAAAAAGGGAPASTTPIGTPAFSAMPPVRSPSPLSSARLVYNTAGGGGDATAAAAGGPPSPGSASTGSSGPGGFGGAGLPSPPSSSYMTGYQHHHHAAIAAPPSVEALAHASPKVLAVARRKGVTLVNMSAFDMWGHAGFLSKVFAPFTDHGVSVDLIATSQYAVSVTLDHIPEGVHGDTFRKVVGALGRVCATTVRYPCAVVSVVGRGLRHYLPQLGAAMSVLRGVPVHMVSEASEDLNLSFVVDEEHADRLVKVRMGRGERRGENHVLWAARRQRDPHTPCTHAFVPRSQLSRAACLPHARTRRSCTACCWRATAWTARWGGTRSLGRRGRSCRAAAPPSPARPSTEQRTARHDTWSRQSRPRGHAAAPGVADDR